MDQSTLLARLREIPDPGGNADIVTAGRLVSAKASETVATVVIDATGLTASQQQDLETSIREHLGTIEVRVAMTADKPTRRIIAVGSGKGGVGKSTLAANLAIAIARQGRSVGLVDADIYGPSQPRLMGNSDKPEAVNKQIIPVAAHGVRFLSIGQLVDPDSALAWRGPMASNALGQLIEGDWADTEILVIDLPPGTGDVQLSIVQKWKPNGVVIVSTPQDLALIDARRAIDLFRKTGVPILGFVENMAGYVCPHCGESSDPFGTGGAEAAAGAMDIPFLGRIPLAMDIRESSDAGTPLAGQGGERAELFASIATGVMQRLETAN